MLARALALAAAGLVLATGLTACGGDSGVSRTIRVTPGGTSIEDAVDSARPGDIVVLAPGTYSEAVKVSRRDITIRGEDRNAVVLDGGDRLANGFFVAADGVAIENLTVRHFTQNGIVFNGAERASNGRGIDPTVDYGAGSDVLDRYAARYITAYNNGLYGIYAFASRNGVIEDSYVSGHPDSGIYVGQCKPCNATVQRVTAEHNAIGYYGTNSSGGVVIAASTFRRNRLGIAPNSQKAEKLAPQAETIVVGNIVEKNDDRLAPMIPKGFFGGGIAIGGGTKNLVIRNLVRGNPLFGIGVIALDAFLPDNNRVISNSASGNGVDLLYSPTSAMDANGNCFATNTFTTSSPFDIESLMPCDGDASSFTIPSLVSPAAPPGVDYRTVPAPGPQPTMPTSAMSAKGGIPSWSAIDIDSISMPTP